MGVHLAKINCIAVGSRAYSATDSDVTIPTSNVFDDDGLPKRASHPLGYKSSDNVRWPARSKRHDHGDGARWIALGRRGGRECRSDRSGPDELQEFSARQFHGVSPNYVRLVEVSIKLTYLRAVIARLDSAIQ